MPGFFCRKLGNSVEKDYIYVPTCYVPYQSCKLKLTFMVKSGKLAPIHNTFVYASIKILFYGHARALVRTGMQLNTSYELFIEMYGIKPEDFSYDCARAAYYRTLKEIIGKEK